MMGRKTAVWAVCVVVILVIGFVVWSGRAEAETLCAGKVPTQPTSPIDTSGMNPVAFGMVYCDGAGGDCDQAFEEMRAAIAGKPFLWMSPKMVDWGEVMLLSDSEIGYPAPQPIPFPPVIVDKTQTVYMPAALVGRE